jgi:hypothetical protein
MTQAVGINFATINVDEGNACEVRIEMFKRDAVGVNTGIQKTFYFEWTVGSPVTCVTPAYMGPDGACLCNNNWQLEQTENNVFTCVVPTCDFAPGADLVWNSLYNMCLCQNGGNLVGLVCENPCNGGSFALGSDVCECNDDSHYYMFGVC